MGFSRFMASTVGRGARVIAGVALVADGEILGAGWWAGRDPRTRRHALIRETAT
jgi:hypothetical protein